MPYCLQHARHNIKGRELWDNPEWDGPGRCCKTSRREETAGKKSKWKDYGKKEKTGDFSSNDLYKMVTA
jgi:hypothetical protein